MTPRRPLQPRLFAFAAACALRVAAALSATAPPRAAVAWTIAGSDSSAGAGVEADLATFRCLGVRGCAVVTALTAQSTQGVKAVLPTPVEHLETTIATLEADLPPAAVESRRRFLSLLSRACRGYSVETSRGAAAVATWLLCRRDAAATATWLFRGGEVAAGRRG